MRSGLLAASFKILYIAALRPTRIINGTRSIFFIFLKPFDFYRSDYRRVGLIDRKYDIFYCFNLIIIYDIILLNRYIHALMLRNLLMNDNQMKNTIVNIFIKILSFLVGIIALSLLLSQIFQPSIFDFHLIYPIIILSVIGAVTAIILLIKKKVAYWLFLFSLFNLLFLYIISEVEHAKQKPQIETKKNAARYS